MYLKQLHVIGFRTFQDTTLNFRQGLNILIGENNTGKTAVIDAIRLCLSVAAERREISLSSDDFHMDDSGKRCSQMEFHLCFSGITPREQGIFVEMLSLADPATPGLQFHMRVTIDTARDRVHRECWGGDKEHQSVPQEVLEQLYFLYLGALRDAGRDLSPSKGNQLSRLFVKLVPGDTKQSQYAKQISDQIKSLNDWQALLKDGKDKINEHLNKLSLQSLPQSVDISFIDAEFRRIVEGLKIRVQKPSPSSTVPPLAPGQAAQSDTLQIFQNGLGYNNLIYIATVLGDLRERRHRDPDSYIALLIEEPEAHLHPQLQDVLFRYLTEIKSGDVQVFVTSHSPTITAKTQIESLIMLSRNRDQILATSLADVDLSDHNKAHLHRFLDVTKSQLFFANGVILVEGISEALLLPELALILGAKYDLDRNGVEVVNIDGVAFEPFAKLFNSDKRNKRLSVRCAVVTDDDSHTSIDGESSSRAENARSLQGGLLRSFLARSTFEYELYLSNETFVLAAYKELHPKMALAFSGTIEDKAGLFVEKLHSVRDKASFAQLLAGKIATGKFSSFSVPQYIQNAIKWIVDGTDTSAKGGS